LPTHTLGDGFYEHAGAKGPLRGALIAPVALRFGGCLRLVQRDERQIRPACVLFDDHPSAQGKMPLAHWPFSHPVSCFSDAKLPSRDFPEVSAPWLRLLIAGPGAVPRRHDVSLSRFAAALPQSLWLVQCRRPGRRGSNASRT
jgi:hypothetical protein